MSQKLLIYRFKSVKNLIIIRYFIVSGLLLVRVFWWVLVDALGGLPNKTYCICPDVSSWSLSFVYSVLWMMGRTAPVELSHSRHKQHKYRCSGKFVAPENCSHRQQYGLGLRLRIGLNLWLGFGLSLVTLWQYGGVKNFPDATSFPHHCHVIVQWRLS